jgi:hypothetical protein
MNMAHSALETKILLGLYYVGKIDVGQMKHESDRRVHSVGANESWVQIWCSCGAMKTTIL